jgi:hypothetical protein
MKKSKGAVDAQTQKEPRSEYRFDEAQLDEKFEKVYADDGTLKLVDVHFWGKDGARATLIVKSKLELEHLKNSAAECKEAKNPKSGHLYSVYEYGVKTMDDIDALPKEAWPTQEKKKK